MSESQPTKKENRKTPLALAFEEKIQQAMDTNHQMGGRSYADSVVRTIQIPDSNEALLALLAANEVVHSPSEYQGELLVEQRVIDMLKRQGFDLFVIHDQTEPMESVDRTREVLGNDNMQDGMYYQKPFRNDEGVIYLRETKPFDLSYEKDLRTAHDLL